jgi:transposase
MEVSPFLPLCEGLHIERVMESTDRLLVHVACVSARVGCPLCGTAAHRIHSRYSRRVADLPCAGRQVTLRLTVRKFFCPNPDCPRKIFAEQFPDLVQAYARITNRLRDALVALGFVTCGEVTSQLAPKLGMSVKPTTILRRLRAVPVAPMGTVRILGVDDFAWKKGQTYGTILVDLELHRPIDLLPDRSEETLEAWLRAHRQIEVVSRDRAGSYAQAVKKGAPQAQQVADRYHLLVNLREGLKKLMDRKQACLPEVEEDIADAIPHKARGRSEEVSLPEASEQLGQDKHFRTMSPKLRNRGSPPPAVVETSSLVRRANRYSRYEAVRALHQQGVSLHKIARRFGMARKTVRQFIRAESFPERSRPASRGSLLDPYKPYLLKRWQEEGCWNGAQLYDEIKERGYTGSGPLLRRFIADLRKQHQAVGTAAVLTLDSSGTTISVPAELPPKPQFTRRMSPTRASWLCVSQPTKLDEKQCQQVEHIRKGHPDLETAYQLSQAFVLMLAERRDTDLDGWLVQAKHSGIAELKSFAQGIRRDYAAVRAAFTSKWSNGQVEAQVNCLKLQKRQMYGRAHFDLLRLHVLYAV